MDPHYYEHIGRSVCLIISSITIWLFVYLYGTQCSVVILTILVIQSIFISAIAITLLIEIFIKYDYIVSAKKGIFILILLVAIAHILAYIAFGCVAQLARLNTVAVNIHIALLTTSYMLYLK